MKREFKPNSNRIESNIEELAKIGKVGESGVRRFVFTPEEMKAREYVIDLMKQAELQVKVDAAGNIIGKRLRCSDTSLPSVMVGSHIDTPILGGKYDGTVGVLGAIESVRLLNQHSVTTRHPIEVVVFAGEELARFGVCFKGSFGMVGLLTEELMREVKDSDGVSYWDAMLKVGLNPEDYESARREPETVKCYLEMHIEQGRVLEEASKQICIVQAIAGASRGLATFHGLADHAGATSMNLRKDALAAAAEVVLCLEKYSQQEAHLGSVGTVGALNVEPGSMNIVPGKVTMSLEIRGVDLASKKRVIANLNRKILEVSTRREMKIETEWSEDSDPTPVPQHMIKLIEGVCLELGIDYLIMPSGAGHDAGFMARITDMGMIFVPSVKGISHAPDEYTRIEDISLGTELLTNVLLRLAEEVTDF